MAALSAASVGAILLDDVDDAHAQSVFDNPDLAQRFARFIEGGNFDQFFEGEPPPFFEAEPPIFFEILPPGFQQIASPFGS